MAFGAAMAIVGGAMGVSMMMPPFARNLTYGMNKGNPNVIPDIALLVEARYRGEITPELFTTYLNQSGIGFGNVERIWNISENLLSIIELINLYRRGKISQELLMSDAQKLKWSGNSVTNLLTITEPIPSAGDIISFAVREVYSPEIAEAFGQYEGLEEVYKKAESDIKAIGMVKEHFAKYWAAHWLLPSVGQGFEMVHRGVIPLQATNDEPLSLERLMVALDIMPAWRDKLTAISYSPFTRVDVRRMHKIGVLQDEDLLRAYMDLGYDKDKGQRMAEFTILYNADPPEDEETEKDKDKAKERDLTKTDILYGYENNILVEGLARDGLSLLGYDDTEVEYYISKVKFKREKDETDAHLKYYHDAYIRGIMTHNELVDKLNILNLSGERSNYLFKIWDLERLARTTKPTKAELMTFLRKKVIDLTTFIEEMKGLGYPEKYINWYRRTL